MLFSLITYVDITKKHDDFFLKKTNPIKANISVGFIVEMKASKFEEIIF
jgi:hypothetical protein